VHAALDKALPDFAGFQGCETIVAGDLLPRT